MLSRAKKVQIFVAHSVVVGLLLRRPTTATATAAAAAAAATTVGLLLLSSFLNRPFFSIYKPVLGK